MDVKKKRMMLMKMRLTDDEKKEGTRKRKEKDFVGKKMFAENKLDESCRIECVKEHENMKENDALDMKRNQMWKRMMKCVDKKKKNWRWRRKKKMMTLLMMMKMMTTKSYLLLVCEK